MSDDYGLQSASGYLTVSDASKAPYEPEVEEKFRADAAEIIARYPHSRSALLPMLHLVQSVDGYVTGRGIELCADILGLTAAEVSGVATFYTQYKRHPNGTYTVGVCTNTLCAVMGGDEIWDTVSEHLGIGHDETTPDGAITLERIECNAACDFAPVVMANWEFMDNQTPESTVEMVDDLRAGRAVAPTRGPDIVHSFKEVSRTLAGFDDGLADQGVGAGPASLVGLEIAKESGWQAPVGDGGPVPGASGKRPAAKSTAAKSGTSKPATASATKAAAAATLAGGAGAVAAKSAATGKSADDSATKTSATKTPETQAPAAKQAAAKAAPAKKAADAKKAAPAKKSDAQKPAEKKPTAAAKKAAAKDASLAALAKKDGVALPNADGSAPAGYDIKGNENSMLYHTPDSPWYAITIAEVWFNKESAARAAGFSDARERRRKGKA